jgi:tetratricopeptide (TPR) repeat protein
MEFDPDNPVIKLCVEGMNAEGEGNIDQALQLFQQAWDTAANDFEAFTAAHYLARNQKDPNDNLKWNLEALTRAEAVDDEGIKGHYPSLYLNVGKSYETLGDMEQAANYYLQAADSSIHLPAGKYSDMIKSGISAGLQRVGHAKPIDENITMLVNKWCETKDLKPLSVILPVYVGYLGTENDRNKLLSAFSYLSAMRCLEEEEQGIVERVIRNLNGSI